MFAKVYVFSEHEVLRERILEDVVRSRSERDVCEFVRVERFVRERGGEILNLVPSRAILKQM